MLDRILYQLLMISSREVENVWQFHDFRSGSSLSVHDSHAFQRTPGPATLSRAESVHSVSWRNRSFCSPSRKHFRLYKVFFDCLLWCLIRWTDILSHFSEEHLQGNYGKPANWKLKHLLNPSAICPGEVLLCFRQVLDGFANLCIDDDAQVPSN